MQKLVAHVVVKTTVRSLGMKRDIYEDATVVPGDQKDCAGDGLELHSAMSQGLEVRFFLVNKQKDKEPIFFPGQKLRITVEPV